MVLASPEGGKPPLDPKSSEPGFQTDLTRRFEADSEANAVLADTARLDGVTHNGFDAVFYPGGHGPLWDLAEDPASIKLIEKTLRAGKPVTLVCHAPGVLRHAKAADGKPLVEGKAVTGFTNTEEEAVGLTEVVPFLVEDELKRNGGKFSKAGDWEPYVLADGLLITGRTRPLQDRGRAPPGSFAPGLSTDGARRSGAASRHERSYMTVLFPVVP